MVTCNLITVGRDTPWTDVYVEILDKRRDGEGLKRVKIKPYAFIKLLLLEANLAGLW
jgi:hypothetical protein